MALYPRRFCAPTRSPPDYPLLPPSAVPFTGYSIPFPRYARENFVDRSAIYDGKAPRHPPLTGGEHLSVKRGGEEPAEGRTPPYGRLRSVHDEAERASEPKVPFFEEVASPPGVGAHFSAKRRGGTTTFPVPAEGDSLTTPGPCGMKVGGREASRKRSLRREGEPAKVL